MFRCDRLRCAALLLTVLPLTFAGAASAAEREIALDAQQGVALTVYNNDLALVRDQRRIDFGDGENALALVGVSAKIRPETVDFAVLGDDGKVRVVEQYFAYDLLSPQALLEKSLGKTIGVVRVDPATGREVVERGEVLSTNGGLVLRIGDRVETVDPGAQVGSPFRFVFDEVPPGLRARPTLVLTVDSDGAADRDAVLRYLTGGLSWTADYVAELGPDDDTLSLKGWVTIANNSGTDYRDARLQLVAGDVNLVPRPMKAVPMAEMAAAAPAPAARDFSQQGLADYHLYTLDRRTTLLDRQTKQIALLAAPAVAARKEYISRGGTYYYQSRMGPIEPQKVEVWLDFKNDKEDGLGRPLPRGVIRVYTADSSGDEQFIGEDTIDHTADGETVRLRVGRAFDVSAERTQTDYRDNRSSRETYWEYDSSYEVVVRNAKDKPVTVKLEEPMPGDWTVTAESRPHEKKDAQTAVWTVAVPAKGETRLTYSVRIVVPR
jgi:hypothetical protein